MKIKKAVITAAGTQQRSLPLQQLVDRDGVRKSALSIIFNEVRKAGIEEIAVIVYPGDESAYTAATDHHTARRHFIAQPAPLGYGHAVFCARSFVGDEPFLHLVGDHLYISRVAQSCAQQLIETAVAETCSVSAVQATRESMLPYFGTVGGRLAPGRRGLYEIEDVIEKPTPTEAEERLLVAGLRAGYYLCFFGMHVLTPTVMDILAEEIAQAAPAQCTNLSVALAKLAARERYLAYEVQGRRFNIDAKYGLLNAQLALALNGQDRDEVLTQLVELLASRGA